MQIVIDIPEWKYKSICEGVEASKRCGVVGIDPNIHKVIYNGTPLPKYMKELKRILLMEVDGGTDDRYLRYTDVCDQISNTIDAYIKAESAMQNADSD